MLPAEQIEWYNDGGNDPHSWASSADILLIAADFLKSHRDTYDPFGSSVNVGDVIPPEGRILCPELMLRGFAVECLFKALWVKGGNKLAVQGQFVPIPNAGEHDLVQLADAVSLPLTRDQRDMLKRLTLFTSSGRYPIPRDWSRHRIQRLHPTGKGIPTYWAAPGDYVALESLIASAAHLLNLRGAT